MQGDPVHVHGHPRGGCREDRDRLLPVVPRARSRGTGDKLEHGKLRLTTRNTSVLGGCRSPAQIPREVLGVPQGCPKAAWMWCWAPARCVPAGGSWGPEAPRGAFDLSCSVTMISAAIAAPREQLLWSSVMLSVLP